MEYSVTSSGYNLGSLLVTAEIISEEQLQKVVQLSERSDERVDRLLLVQKLITPQLLALTHSLLLGIPFINLKTVSANPQVIEIVPESVCRKYNVMPMDFGDSETIVLAMEDPGNLQAIEAIAAVIRKSIEPVISIPQDIQESIDLNYRAGGEIEQQLNLIPTRFRKEGITVEQAAITAEEIQQAPVVRAIDLLIKQAVRDRASDIHIEPQADRLRIRYRIDGILHDVMSLPLTVLPPLISRLKIMAGLNIAERRRPQDGQITFNMGDRMIDLRVATANTVHGEMSVLRILDKTFAFLPLPDIGFIPDVLYRYMQMVKTPFGMILISGPTGSGKTTTQYATVNQLDGIGRNIITIEDPVEYHFDNINQMQVAPQAGVTFATGLRACMRLDPDVILVGEIRDQETAQIATQAALTGHLVLSSVHANDSVGVVFRMVDLGVEPFLIASALIGVVSQRMVRRVCPYCYHLAEVSVDEREAYESEMHEKRQEFLAGSGCTYCANTGYLGRTGIFEVMHFTETMRRLLLEGAGGDAIRERAIEDGMASLWHDGMLKVQEGITTPGEILRNVYTMGK